MEINEKLEEIAMTIIANAGASKSTSFAALSKAKGGDFEEAKKLLKAADEAEAEAHKMHSTLLQMFAKGEVKEADILIAHAQDHLMAATLSKELIYELVEVYEKLKER
ncbi:MAG: PTS lactose/cellobiose transporter subunit IIA [Clostridia bacterium]|nr:PTS lactose/cellobiose transporter subunit IIA [Clostridia bacterium]